MDAADALSMIGSLLAGGSIASLLLLRPRRRLIEADASRMNVATAISLIGPLERRIRDLHRQLDRCEARYVELKRRIESGDE